MTSNGPKPLIGKEEQEKLIQRLERGSWRQRLRVNPSNADIAIYEELERQGLTKGMMTNIQICIIKDGKEHKIGTIPDAFWPTEGVIFYADGPVHKSEHRRKKDAEIDRQLHDHGLKVLREPYRVPLSQKRLKEIVDRIREALGR